jgi:hypothetical protein
MSLRTVCKSSFHLDVVYAVCGLATLTPTAGLSYPLRCMLLQCELELSQVVPW